MNKKLEYWTYERCYAAAAACSNINEMKTKFNGAYERAKDNGWFEDYTWLKRKEININEPIYCIYAYEDTKSHCVYVGLTNDLKRRMGEHKKKNYRNNCEGKYDAVRKYFEMQDMPIPEPVVICEKLTGIEAQKKEHEVLEEYIKKGWTPINTAKTGVNSSSLGSVGYGRWNFEECLKVVALCNSRAELSKRFSGAYDSIIRHGWTDILPPKKNEKKFYSPKECEEFCKHYENIEEVKQNNYKLYLSLRNHKLVLKMFPKKSESEKIDYDYETCINLAKNYKNRKDVQKNNPSLLYHIQKLGYSWSDIKYCKKNELGYDECKKICENVNGVYELQKDYYSVYKECVEQNWIEEFFPLPKPLESVLETQIENNFLDDNETEIIKDCVKKALECSTKKEYREKYKKQYQISSKYKLLQSFIWLKGCKKTFSEEECREAALLCSTKKQFREKYKRFYETARLNNWLQNYTWLIKKC